MRQGKFHITQSIRSCLLTVKEPCMFAAGCVDAWMTVCEQHNTWQPFRNDIEHVLYVLNHFMYLKDTPLIYMYVNEFLYMFFFNTAGLFQLILSGKKMFCTVAVKKSYWGITPFLGQLFINLLTSHAWVHKANTVALKGQMYHNLRKHQKIERHCKSTQSTLEIIKKKTHKKAEVFLGRQ